MTFRSAVTLWITTSLSLSISTALAQQDPDGLAAPNTARITDAAKLLAPSATTMSGLLGERYQKNAVARLLNVNEEELLAGFRHKPGKQAWIGEHVGKFLHAASLAYASTGNTQLRQKIDRVAAELMKTQEPDGYLGTYVPGKRFGLYPDADWDVWVHKYDLLGLLTYYQFTGNHEALEACRRVGNLLIDTFGPNKKSILSAGTHVGMAATSVLEPVVLLYRATADPRYLEFAKYLVAAWDEPNGPRVKSTLMSEKSVRKTANGKAYEMLSNLSGLCELYRATGDPQYLEPAKYAWSDISQHRLYITGSGSAGEHWQEEYHLPNGNSASICETCVTVSWEQLNLQLYRITGEQKYMDQLERSIYNHLLGAQKPSGDAWCYYTPLQGVKPYGSETNCCLSSGPRGVALLPTFAYSRIVDGIAVNLYGPSMVSAAVAGGKVSIEQKTDYPLGGSVSIDVTAVTARHPFSIDLRIPSWTPRATVTFNGARISLASKPGSYLSLKRAWHAGDKLNLVLDLNPRVIFGDHENDGKVAVMVGPLVLAADEGHNPTRKPILRCDVPGTAESAAGFKLERSVGAGSAGEPVYEVKGGASLKLVPFYAAGADGSLFAVWLPRIGHVKRNVGSLLANGQESRSEAGNLDGSISDDDPMTAVVTFNGRPQSEAWFAVALPAPAEVSRVVFCHGKTFHDGGWFDTSGGKPRIQVKRAATGAWEDVAILESYPDSTNNKPATSLEPGKGFEARFAVVKAFAVRVIGKPAGGDNPTQAFASCGELKAFLDR